MKYTFICKRASDYCNHDPNIKPCEQAYWIDDAVDGQGRWFVSFEDLSDLMDFIRNLPRNGNDDCSIIIDGSMEDNWNHDRRKFDILTIYDGYVE